MHNKLAGLSALTLLASAAPALATVTVFDGNLAGFNAAASSPPVTINFDALSGNIAGNTISGVTFSSPDGNTLEVVPASTTVSLLGGPSHNLSATSGLNVLSPGGATMPGGSTLAERDSLQLDFASPVNAFGLDILFESLDCCSFMSYTIYGAGNVVLSSGGVNASGPGTASGPWFFGFISDNAATNATRIVFTETDGDSVNPDANVGYDTLRFVAQAVGAVPEPSSWAMMLLGFGFIGAVLRSRRSAVTAHS